MTDSPDADQSALELRRPLAFIDTESTGVDPRTARIVRLTVLTLQPDGTRSSRTALVNPGEPIPPGATAVHGITDDDVADSPSFRSYARSLASSLADCDLAGFAIERFHLPLLQAEFERAGVEFDVSGRSVVDAMSIYHRLRPRNLEAAHAEFVGGEAPDRSEPEPRVEAIYRVLLGELAAEPVIGRDPASIMRWGKGADDTWIDPDGRFAWSAAGEAVFNFGKHRGRRVSDIAESEPDYLGWLIANEDFPSQARAMAEAALRGESLHRDA
jgi:DNA polymerase-3 subunit epsilon